MNNNILLTNEEIQLEHEILGGLFLDNNLLINTKANIKANMFSLATHRDVYKAFLTMKDKGLDIDAINFIEHYKDKIKDMGGTQYIMQVAYCLPTKVGYDSKLKILANNHKRHNIKKLIPMLQEENDLEKLTELVENTLKEVYESEMSKEIDIAEEYEEYLRWIEDDRTDIGIKSGLVTLDRVLGNFQQGRLITIFARSGIGKSTVSIQIALNMALQKKKVIYASGEMGVNEVLTKMSASRLSILTESISSKKLDAGQRENIATLSIKLLESKFHVTNETNFEKLIAEIKAYKLKNGLDIIFVDYVNKYTSAIKGNSLTEKLGTISATLKDLAMSENICVVLLAQANRESDKKVGEFTSDKIGEADLQDSARLEQDSDQLIALYRNKKLDNADVRESLAAKGEVNYNSYYADENPNAINMVICKNRHGKRESLSFKWEGEYSRVRNWTR